MSDWPKLPKQESPLKDTVSSPLPPSPRGEAIKPSVFLITGGTGSLGTALTKHLLSQGHKVRAYARSEHGHERLQAQIPEEQKPRLSSLIGAVEDLQRLRRAVQGADYVIHGAAQKVIGLCEYNPGEAVKTNILGTNNVMLACVEAGIKKAVFISSDKAAASVNHYGHTKACGEKLWLHGNVYEPVARPFVAVRYGNCWNSRGSVFGAFSAQRNDGYLKVTDPESTRFHWKISDAVRFVLKALELANGGEMWIPKLPAYKLNDLASAYMAVAKMSRPFVVVGLRSVEKLHESMIAADEAFMARDADTHYVLTPGQPQKQGLIGGYHSSTHWRIGRMELEKLIQETIDAVRD